MVHIRQRLEQAEFSEIVNVLGNLEANVGVFGGRNYTYNSEYLGQKVTGQLAFKEIIAIAAKHVIEGNNEITYPEGLYIRMINLQNLGEEKLEKASIIQRILTGIRRFFGNWNFDKVKVMAEYSFEAGYEQCRRELQPPQEPSNVSLARTSPVKPK